MKLVIIEPLGVEKETLLEIADKAVGKDAEIVYYDTRVTDDATLSSAERTRMSLWSQTFR